MPIIADSRGGCGTKRCPPTRCSSPTGPLSHRPADGLAHRQNHAFVSARPVLGPCSLRLSQPHRATLAATFLLSPLPTLEDATPPASPAVVFHIVSGVYLKPRHAPTPWSRERTLDILAATGAIASHTSPAVLASSVARCSDRSVLSWPVVQSTSSPRPGHSRHILFSPGLNGRFCCQAKQAV